MPKTSNGSARSTEPTGIKYSDILPVFRQPLWGTTDKRYNVLYGGAGSGKTHAIIQYLCYLFMTVEDCEFAIARKSNPALKRSVYMGSPSIVRQLAEWDAPLYDWHNKTNQVIRNPIKNNSMYFIAIDDPEKIKSMNLNYIWMEEATEFNVDDFKQFNTRLRGPNKNGINRMWLSFNPVSLYNWVYQWFIVNPTPETIKNTNLHRSVPFDNPRVPDDYLKSLIAMGEADENYFRVYLEGEPGVPMGLVYKNFRFSDPSDWPSEVWHQTPFYGVDFGFNDPMAMVEVRRYDKQYYVRERYYKTNQHIEDLISFMNDEGISPKSLIFCDSASPERIHKIQSAGYSAVKSNKDIFAGISELNSSTINISHDSENLRMEAMSYQWKPRSSQDVQDSLKDEPLDANNHILDAARYAIFTSVMMGRSGIVGTLGKDKTEDEYAKKGKLVPKNW